MNSKLFLSFLPVSTLRNLKSWKFSPFINSAELKGLSERSCGLVPQMWEPLVGRAVFKRTALFLLVLEVH